jgi:hypothetical protein
VVDVDGEPPACTFTDFEPNRLKCKHIYAVEYLRSCMPDDGCTEKPKRAKYCQDWTAYNIAQTSE